MRRDLDLGGFIIDPDTQEFHRIIACAVPGEGFGCLIKQYGDLYLPGKHMWVDPWMRGGIIRISHMDLRWERSLLMPERELAQSFDMGFRIVDPVELRFNLSDGSWTPEQRQVSSPAKNPTGPRGPKISARQRRRMELLGG